MENKFTVKFQRIGSTPHGEVKSFSVPLIIEPPDDISSKRGLLYSTIEVSGPNQVDPNLVIKVVSDTLENEYFNTEEGTPLSSLEKALIGVRDKVLGLLQDPKVMSLQNAEFHAVVSILWGNILYVVQYGNGCSYLIRDGKVKPINTSSEGNFSVASGTVADSDIVVLGSRGFCEKYSQETLLSATGDTTSSPLVSAVILKFYQDKKTEAGGFVDIRDPLAEKIKVTRSFNGNFYSKKRTLGVIAVVLALVLLGSVYFAFKKNKTVTKTTKENVVIVKGRESIDEAQKLIGVDDKRARDILSETRKALEEAAKLKPADASEIQKLLDETTLKLDVVDKVVRVDDTPYYDVRIDDKEADPTEISVASTSTALVIDASRSKFYRLSFLDSPSLTPIESTQAASPKFLSPVESGVAFLGQDAFYEYDGGNSKIKKVNTKIGVPVSEISASSSYIGNVYYVHKGKILKNTITWAEDQEALSNAVSMAIDGSINVLNPTSIVKFAQGKKVEFSIKNLSVSLSNASQIYTTVDLNNIYILDRGNERVVVLDKEGNLKEQFLQKKDSQSWKDLRSISVSRDEKTLLVLSSSKIFKIKL